MKKVLLVYVVLIAGILIWYYGIGKEKNNLDKPGGTALKVSKHSARFNESLEKIMSSYYSMIDDFVKADTGSINQRILELRNVLDSLKVEDLKQDSSIYETAATVWEDCKTEINGMATDPSLQAKRESLNLFSNELFTLLLTVRYDLSKLYWLESSSAFGVDTPGNWISKSEQSNNPYNGNKDVVVKKVIDFGPADSTKTK